MEERGVGDKESGTYTSQQGRLQRLSVSDE